jgi:hypothetical protein
MTTCEWCGSSIARGKATRDGGPDLSLVTFKIRGKYGHGIDYGRLPHQFKLKHCSRYLFFGLGVCIQSLLGCFLHVSNGVRSWIKADHYAAFIPRPWLSACIQIYQIPQYPFLIHLVPHYPMTTWPLLR